LLENPPILIFSTIIRTDPIPWHPPKLSTINGKARTFPNPSNVKFQRIVMEHLYNVDAPKGFDCPLLFKVAFNMAIPITASKKEYAELLGEYHTETPDLDNLEKNLFDGFDSYGFFFPAYGDKIVSKHDSIKLWSAIGLSLIHI